MSSVEAQRWRGQGFPESMNPSDSGINPHFLQPHEGLPSSSAQSFSRQSWESMSRLSQVRLPTWSPINSQGLVSDGAVTYTSTTSPAFPGLLAMTCGQRHSHRSPPSEPM